MPQREKARRSEKKEESTYFWPGEMVFRMCFKGWGGCNI